MSTNSYFDEFLKRIRPSAQVRKACVKEHTLLRDRLMADPDLSDIVITTFLQGSYRRSTLVHTDGDENPDVDVVVVTTLPRDLVTPQQALNVFKPFLRTHYKGLWKTQGRSLGITGPRVDLDLVVTSAPSVEVRDVLRNDSATIDVEDSSSPTSADWEQQEALWIPNRDVGKWERTHPMAQLAWTRAKNKRTNGHYVNVVKVLKWWKRNHGSLPKHPKSYPLEHIIGDCCPDDIGSVAEGVTRTLETIRDHFGPWASIQQVPVLGNRGLPNENVMSRISAGDFATFVEQASKAAADARQALDNADDHEATKIWNGLLGAEFDIAPKKTKGRSLMSSAVAPAATGYTFPDEPAAPKKPRGFA